MAVEYYITKSRYIQQEGEAEPNFVGASQLQPALVRMSSEFVPSKSDKHIHKRKPKKPMPAHAGKEQGDGGLTGADVANQEHKVADEIANDTEPQASDDTEGEGKSKGGKKPKRAADR